MFKNTHTAELVLPDHSQVEVVIKAVRAEDVDALRDAMEALCEQYRQADASIRVTPCEAGTVLKPARAAWIDAFAR